VRREGGQTRSISLSLSSHSRASPIAPTNNHRAFLLAACARPPSLSRLLTAQSGVLPLPSLRLREKLYSKTVRSVESRDGLAGGGSVYTSWRGGREGGGRGEGEEAAGRRSVSYAPTMMLLIGMWISLTKKPMKPMMQKPISVAMAILDISVHVSASGSWC